MEKRVFNFSAGPAVLPESVLKKAQKELLNYKGAGMSILEMSHRSKAFETIISNAETLMRRILGIPDEYAVLFLQGGASLQFSMVPMNLYIPGKPMLAVNTGVWSQKAIKEMKKIGECQVISSSEDRQFTYIPDSASIQIKEPASFLHITSNNTIFGTQWNVFPHTGNLPLVADMSSDILSRQVDIRQFGLIYAGAQKNIGPAGVTVVIIRKDLAERALETLPSMLQYRTHIQEKSLYNTPPTFAIYVISLVLEWIEEIGGLKEIERRNHEKADRLYHVIENSDFYYLPVQKGDRSKMNVVFRIRGNNEVLEKRMIEESEENGLKELKGHRSVGGLRASIYNAQTFEAIDELADFLRLFEKKHLSELTITNARTPR